MVKNGLQFFLTHFKVRAKVNGLKVGEHQHLAKHLAKPSRALILEVSPGSEPLCFLPLAVDNSAKLLRLGSD